MKTLIQSEKLLNKTREMKQVSFLQNGVQLRKKLYLNVNKDLDNTY